MVDQLVNGFRNNSPGAQRYEARRQQAERANEEGHGHQQEEQFRITAGIYGVVPSQVPCYDPDVDGANDQLSKL